MGNKHVQNNVPISKRYLDLTRLLLVYWYLLLFKYISYLIIITHQWMFSNILMQLVIRKVKINLQRREDRWFVTMKMKIPSHFNYADIIVNCLMLQTVWKICTIESNNWLDIDSIIYLPTNKLIFKQVLPGMACLLFDINSILIFGMCLFFGKCLSIGKYSNKLDITLQKSLGTNAMNGSQPEWTFLWI